MEISFKSNFKVSKFNQSISKRSFNLFIDYLTFVVDNFFQTLGDLLQDSAIAFTLSGLRRWTLGFSQHDDSGDLSIDL
jgi:hypothetical protein